MSMKMAILLCRARISRVKLGGFAAKEIEEQMQIFAEEVMPVLARECGGKVELPAPGLDLAG